MKKLFTLEEAYKIASKKVIVGEPFPQPPKEADSDLRDMWKTADIEKDEDTFDENP